MNDKILAILEFLNWRKENNHSLALSNVNEDNEMVNFFTVKCKEDEEIILEIVRIITE